MLYHLLLCVLSTILNIRCHDMFLVLKTRHRAESSIKQEPRGFHDGLWIKELELNFLWKRGMHKLCLMVHWSFFFRRLCICMTCNAWAYNLRTQTILLYCYFQIKQLISVCMSKCPLSPQLFKSGTWLYLCRLQISNVKYVIICIFWRNWFILSI